MAYQITYAWEKEKELIRRRRISVPFILGITAFAVILAVRILFPQQSRILDELLHPLTDERLAAALSDLYRDLEYGIPAGEAVFTFCGEIIENAH